MLGGCRFEGLGFGRRCGGRLSPSAGCTEDVSTSLFELETFDSFDSTVPSLLVDDLASFKEGDDDGERTLDCCCVSDNGVKVVDPVEERVTLSGTVACIGKGSVDRGCVVSVFKGRNDDATLPAFRLVLERPACSISPASRASDSRDAGRDTTFCGGIIVTTLSFLSFGPFLPHNSPELPHPRSMIDVLFVR